MIMTRSVAEGIRTRSVGTRLADASAHGVKFLPGVLTTVSIFTLISDFRVVILHGI